MTSTSASNTGNQQLAQQPLDVALRPLFGVGNDIKNTTGYSKQIEAANQNTKQQAIDNLEKNPNGYCGMGGTGVLCPVGINT